MIHHFCTYQNDHHDKSDYNKSLYKDIIYIVINYIPHIVPFMTMTLVSLTYLPPPFW